MRSSGVGAAWTRMKKVVLPYMIIRSPGRTTPTLIASLNASTAPTATGVRRRPWVVFGRTLGARRAASQPKTSSSKNERAKAQW